MPTAFNDPDFIPGALTGFILHTVMWFTRIHITSFSCINECQSLMMLDMPISLFYFFMDDSLRLLMSLLLGGVEWALGGWLGLKSISFAYSLLLKYRK